MNAPEVSGHTVIEYRINRHDRIVEVSENWKTFAIENDGPPKVIDVVGDSLWDHISDRDTQDLYSLLIDSVRLSRAQLSFPYRCDSPTVKRFMAMAIDPCDDHEVHFRSEIVAIEPLCPEISFVGSSIYRIKEVHVCSNCRKVKVGKVWMDVTEAFRTGDMTANKIHFRAVHRVCPHCLRDMQNRVSNMVAATDRRINQLSDILQRLRTSELKAQTQSDGESVLGPS